MSPADAKPKRLTIPQVMYLIGRATGKPIGYRKAYELVNGGVLGEVQQDGRSRTVLESAVKDYLAKLTPKAVK